MAARSQPPLASSRLDEPGAPGADGLPDEASSSVGWPSEELQAAFGALVEGAGLDSPGLTGSIGIVVPPTAGRPRRSRSSPPPPGSADPSPRGGNTDLAQGTLEVRDGRIVRWNAGQPVSGAMATLTLPVADARQLLDGTGEPSVFFMQGRLKVDGDMAAVLALLRSTATSGYRRGRAVLARSFTHS